MKKRIAILGAGAAGLTLAWKLLERSDLEIDVKIIEKEPMVGGVASGFEYDDLNLDYGSHKLNSQTPSEILKDIREILGNDLLTRTNNSRMRFLKRFISIPFSGKSFFAGLPFSFITGLMGNSRAGSSGKQHHKADSYAEILTKQLGKRLCKSFYFPYIEKVWGLHPRQIAPLQISDPVLPLDFPVRKNREEQQYYYPKHGFLQLFEEMMRRIRKKGGKFLLMQEFTQLTRSSDGCLSCLLKDGSMIDFDLIFITIPITDFVSSIRQIYPENVTEIISDPLEVPENVLEAARQIQYRNTIFCYLILGTGQFTTYDTHYFPESGILFSRISESRNFDTTPNKKTGLCVEIPCSAHDDIWNKEDNDIIKRVTADLEKSGMQVGDLVIDSVVRRIENVSPLYNLELENRIRIIEDYLHTIQGLIVLRQQGFTSHDFLHYTLETAYKAAACLSMPAFPGKTGTGV